MVEGIRDRVEQPPTVLTEDGPDSADMEEGRGCA